MKKLMVLLLVALLSSQIYGQEVVYGNVRTDGYQKITKGALWSKRPEAKKIYEGLYPSGFDVYTLESDCFVRFIDEEHNHLDCNYIVFPKGEKVYKNNQDQYFAAICGNRIDFIKPINTVNIVNDNRKSNSESNYQQNTTGNSRPTRTNFIKTGDNYTYQQPQQHNYPSVNNVYYQRPVVVRNVCCDTPIIYPILNIRLGHRYCGRSSCHRRRF
jgi:hypothetical protein